jgi:hypothetical protein
MLLLQKEYVVLGLLLVFVARLAVAPFFGVGCNDESIIVFLTIFWRTVCRKKESVDPELIIHADSLPIRY